MALAWDESTQKLAWTVGLCLCCLLTGWGGYQTARRKGRSVWFWTPISALLPPVYCLLFHKMASFRQPCKPHFSEYVAFAVAGLMSFVLLLLFLILMVTAMSSGRGRSRSAASRSYRVGSGGYNNGCCYDGGGCGGCDGCGGCGGNGGCW